VIPLVDVRARVAEALEPLTEDDPVVIPEPTDAVEAPCVLLRWSEPWLEPFGQSPTFNARLEVVCIAGRFEVGAGVAELESLVTFVVGRLEINRAEASVVATVSAPARLEVGGVVYLSASVFVRIPVALVIPDPVGVA
jgi:hypothetical protein